MAIERLLLLHLNLIELCNADDTKYLDEDATEDELLEPILYFYSTQLTSNCTQYRNYNQQNSSLNNDNNSINNGLNYSTTISTTSYLDRSYDVKEAIQFSGLCTALFNLPDVLSRPDDPTKIKNDVPLETSVVHLSNCTLVFQPLESQYLSVKISKRPLIIAVAQLSTNINHREDSFTSSAVSAAIQRCHEIFCLLRGGGIHNRLISFDLEEQLQGTKKLPEGEAILHSPLYGTNMHRLFELRKKRRKLQRNIEKKQYMIQYNSSYLLNDNLRQSQETTGSSFDNNDSATSSIDNGDNIDDDEEDDDNMETITSLKETLSDIENELIQLELIVPIRSVRADLGVHYDTFLSESHWYRNCIDLIPPPIPFMTECNGIMSQNSSCYLTRPFRSMDTESTLQLKLAVRELLSSTAEIVSIATYVHGRLLFQCTDESNNREKGNLAPTLPISYATYNQVMQYMLDISCRMQCQTSYVEIDFPVDKSFSNNESTYRRTNGFVQIPPLSLLSSLDSLGDSTIRLPNADHKNTTAVWAPKVWIPFSTSAPSIPESKLLSEHQIVRIQQFRVCLYTYGPCALLLFLEDSNAALYENLMQINEWMSTKLNKLCPSDLSDVSTNLSNFDVPTERLVQSGQAIVVVDRMTDSAFVFDSSLDNCTNRPFEYDGVHLETLVERPGDRLRRILFNAPNRTRNDQGILSPRRLRIGESNNTHNSGGGGLLDWRYQIAYSLSTETLMTFDDIIDEIRRHAQQVNDAGTVSNNSDDDGDLRHRVTIKRELYVETCDKWIYANTDGNQELYILLDTFCFASIEQVRAQVQYIQKSIGKDCTE